MATLTFAGRDRYTTLRGTTAAVIADQTGKLRNAVTQTIRRTLINVPARVASSARKLRLHLPERWPWAREWAALLTHSTAPPSTVVS